MVSKNLLFVWGWDRNLVMWNGDPRDGLFYPTRILMVYSYIVQQINYREYFTLQIHRNGMKTT